MWWAEEEIFLNDATRMENIISRKLCYFLRHYEQEEWGVDKINFSPGGWYNLDQVVKKMRFSRDKIIQVLETSTSHSGELRFEIKDFGTEESLPEQRCRARYGHSFDINKDPEVTVSESKMLSLSLVDLAINVIVRHAKCYPNLGDLQDESVLDKLWKALIQANQISNPVIKSFASQYATKLNLDRVAGLVTNRTLNHIGRTCRHLKFLNLRGCDSLNDSMLEYLLKRCTKLHYLGLSNCCNITDDAIAKVTPYLKELEEFYIKYTPKVTGQSCGYFHILTHLEIFLPNEFIQFHMMKMHKIRADINEKIEFVL